MSVPTKLVDPKTGIAANVTEYGQLVVAPVDYSVPSAVTMGTVNTAYNFISPNAGHGIVITDIILTANKNVGANDAAVDIYMADADDTLTISTGILSLEMLKKTTISLTGLNMLVPEGFWVNGKTDDDDVFVTIMYYYVPKD